MSSRTRKRGSIVIAMVAVVALLAMLTPAQAAPGLIVSGPGNAFLPVYYTHPAVVKQGQPVNYRNLDIAIHDVRSTSGLFYTVPIGFNKQTSVIGAKNLKKGTYKFYCSFHPLMKGQLRVI